MAIRLTESKLRQIIREEAAKLSNLPIRRLSEMAPAPAGQVVVAIYAGPDGAELELNNADDGSDTALQVREDFELDSMDAESPGGFGRALKKAIPQLKRLGVTHVSFNVGDSDQTPVPLDTAAPVLVRLVRQAMRGDY